MLGTGIGLGLSPCFLNGGSFTPNGGSFTPLSLGSALIEWWDARTSDDLTLGGGNAVSNVAGSKGVYALVQATGSLQAIWDAGGFIKFDATDDYFTLTLTSAVAQGQIYWCTPYGWYKSGIANWTVGTHRINGANVSQIIFVDAAVITSEQRTELETYIGGTEYWFIGKTSDTTIYNRFDNTTDTNYTLNYIGANAATYNASSSQTGGTIDVVAQGLTAPFHVLYPAAIGLDSTITIMHLYGNQFIGIPPSLAANTGLSQLQFYTNQFVSCIQSIATNTALTVFYMHNNRFSGNIPSVAANTALSQYQLKDNQLVGYDGTSVSVPLGTIFMENNLLTAAAVNAILANVRAAGRVVGVRTMNLSGTGNAAPTGQGIDDAAYLRDTMGWTVTTN